MSRSITFTITVETDSYGLSGPAEIAVLAQAATEIGDSDQDEGKFIHGVDGLKVTWKVTYDRPS